MRGALSDRVQLVHKQTYAPSMTNIATLVFEDLGGEPDAAAVQAHRQHIGHESPAMVAARKARTARLAAENAERAAEKIADKLAEEPEWNEDGTLVKGINDPKELISCMKESFQLAQTAAGQPTEIRQVVHSIDPASLQTMAETLRKRALIETSERITEVIDVTPSE